MVPPAGTQKAACNRRAGEGTKMARRPIDLRSDTVTRPSAGMRRAMFEAEVGDDVLGDDPTVNRLQEQTAELFGKEAALFFPSGTQANQAALHAQTRSGDELFLHAHAHIIYYEQGGAAALSGLQLRCFDSADGTVDPDAMAEFFGTMGRRTQLGPNQVPELLRTHPVTSTRIAEARDRAAQQPPVEPRPSLYYALAKERVRVLSMPSGTDPRAYYTAVIANEPDASTAQVYGLALSQVTMGDASAAIPTLKRLREAYPGVMAFHSLLGQAQLAAGETRAALDTLERARELAPRNVPVTVRYGEALLQAGRPKRAHEVLLDLFNNVPPTQEQIRLTAMAANAAGDVADAYSYMAEYHVMSGDLPLAINQLELALSVPGISSLQRAKFTARLTEFRDAMPKERARLQRSTEPERPSPDR